jgi:hypothetical protein
MRVAASLVKRYRNVTQGCGCLSGKGNVDLGERAAAFLVKRYGNFTQSCGRSSGKGNVDLPKGAAVTNNTFLLFFFNMLLPYAFHLTYLNMSLPTGIHKSSNTCLTCVCCMVKTPLPHIYHMFNMLFMHVHSIFYYYLSQ